MSFWKDSRDDRKLSSPDMRDAMIGAVVKLRARRGMGNVDNLISLLQQEGHNITVTEDPPSGSVLFRYGNQHLRLSMTALRQFREPALLSTIREFIRRIDKEAEMSDIFSAKSPPKVPIFNVKDEPDKPKDFDTLMDEILKKVGD